MMMPRTGLCILIVSAAGASLADPPATILFVRGADRSGGFLEANNDAERTEQLADLTNQSTAGGNHGWFELAAALEAEGYTLVQMPEPLEPDAPPTGQTTGAPLGFASMDLEQFDAIVLGSNNASYPPEQADAIEVYVRSGGGVLFISDANFGSDWNDAPDSDQYFLDRFGWVMQQDQGTYILRRSDGDFLQPSHPILEGVDAFDGEGVSPVVIPETDSVPGVTSTIVVRAKPGQQTRNNDNTGAGSSRPTGDRDATLAVATVDAGRIAAHFDRNTFFNLNGAGTSIRRFDNRAYALNLFAWLTGDPCPADVNGDGVATPADFTAWLGCFNDAGSQSYCGRADVNGDGTLDPADFTAWLAAFNTDCP